MAKGPDYERRVCERLSLWWSADWPEPDDDLCWRTSNSGGRATARRKAGKRAVRHCGDVAATDPRMEPFFRVVSVEIKRGYSRATVADLLDKPARAAEQQYEEWFRKVVVAAEQSGAPYWLLIHRRDRREPLVFLPGGLLDDLGHEVHEPFRPLLTLLVSDRADCVVGTTLASFLTAVPARVFMELAGRKISA